MGEIELKERKPTWDYMLNDLAFSSLKTRVLYGIFDNQERFDFEYQIELKDKEIERLNNIINEFDKWLEVNLTNLEKEETSNIYNEGLKQGMLSNGRLIKSKLQELKGSDK